MWVSEETEFFAILEDFKQRFNGNPRATKLVVNWDRHILLDAADTDTRFALIIQGQELKEIQKIDEYDDEAEGLVHLQADEEVLQQIFSGRYNPATALVDGALAVFSQDRDKVKLEAIAMVVWRLG